MFLTTGRLEREGIPVMGTSSRALARQPEPRRIGVGSACRVLLGAAWPLGLVIWLTGAVGAQEMQETRETSPSEQLLRQELETARERRDEAEREFSRVVVALPAELELVMQQLHSVAAIADLREFRVVPTKPQTVVGEDRVPFRMQQLELSAAGDLSRLDLMLDSLSRSPRLVVVSSLSIRPAPGDSVTFELLLAVPTFSEESLSAFLDERTQTFARERERRRVE